MEKGAKTLAEGHEKSAANPIGPLPWAKIAISCAIMKIAQSLFIAPFLLASHLHAGIGTELLYKGLERPVWAGAPASEKGKLWVMEQAGSIWIIDLKTGKKSAKPFLKIEDKVTREKNEQGMLGLAFAPDFEKSGRYYINYNEKGGDTRIVRYVSEDRQTTDPDSGETILKYKQPFWNHNGGWLDFGPDGMLYIATGDGGAANDPKGKAQNLSSHLGKLLRLDVSGKKGYKIPKDNAFAGKKGALPEIHAYGLRNPWRCSFDRDTGDFWIGDVGQNAWEEINFVEKGEVGGMNFGWRLREADVETPKKKVGGKRPKDNVEPVYVYKHGSGPREGLSVTGGFVYRGSKLADLKGRYIFADYQNPRIWSVVEKGGKVSGFTDHSSELQPKRGSINLISSFGEDADGELYITSLSGPVYRIVAK
ncbi:MAG: PQQ-dependent sugar dehydrogenase [Akkermansiaceae bacterium]|nr:PQQ-dependent sugar dehydrogenase [Akkermansiaceae bacterium]